MIPEKSERIEILNEDDIVKVRKVVRKISTEICFGITDITRIVTAASELARNVYRFAGSGNMICSIITVDNNMGIQMVFEDNGPGIADVDLAMGKGFTTGGGLGLGLPGARRLMDEMEIESEPGKGTKITVRKWLKKLTREFNLEL